MVQEAQLAGKVEMQDYNSVQLDMMEPELFDYFGVELIVKQLFDQVAKELRHVQVAAKVLERLHALLKEHKARIVAVALSTGGQLLGLVNSGR